MNTVEPKVTNYRGSILRQNQSTAEPPLPPHLALSERLLISDSEPVAQSTAQPIEARVTKLKAELKSAETRKSYWGWSAAYFFGWAFVAVLVACLVIALAHPHLWGAIIIGVVALYLAYQWGKIAYAHWNTYKEQRAQVNKLNEQIQAATPARSE